MIIFFVPYEYVVNLYLFIYSYNSGNSTLSCSSPRLKPKLRFGKPVMRRSRNAERLFIKMFSHSNNQ